MHFITAIAAGTSLAFASTAAHAPHWGYEGVGGPDHWADISPEFIACRIGKVQSPVDLGGFDPGHAVPVVADYHPGSLSILHNGHTVQANFAPGSMLTSGGQGYALAQVHFHTPSEEAFNGKHYPMVAHFVHKDASGKLAVLGVMFEEGAPNAELTKLIAHAPKTETPAHEIAGVQFNPSALLPHDLKVYRFAGSLTTPPCSEGVNWHVAVQPVTASKEQIAALHVIMGNNARPIQPLNGRQLVRD